MSISTIITCDGCGAVVGCKGANDRRVSRLIEDAERNGWQLNHRGGVFCRPCAEAPALQYEANKKAFMHRQAAKAASNGKAVEG